MSDWKLVPAEPTEEMIRAAYDSKIVDFMVPREVLIRLFWEMTNAAPTPEVEPFGFWDDQFKCMVYAYVADLSNDPTYTPLYTHPASSELVKAAEELLKYLDHVEKVYAGNSYAEKLRAALDKVKS